MPICFIRSDLIQCNNTTNASEKHGNSGRKKDDIDNSRDYSHSINSQRTINLPTKQSIKDTNALINKPLTTPVLTLSLTRSRTLDNPNVRTLRTKRITLTTVAARATRRTEISESMLKTITGAISTITPTAKIRQMTRRTLLRMTTQATTKTMNAGK